jgi:hypothetical protein
VVKTSTSERSPLSPTLWPPDAFRWWASLGFAALLFFTVFVPPTIFFAVLYAFRLVGIEQLKGLTWAAIFGQFIAYGVSLGVIALFLPAIAQRPLSALGLRRPRWSDIGWGIVGALAMALIGTATGIVQEYVFHLKADEVQVHQLRAAHGSVVFAIVFLACVAAPFFEEIVFRGFVFNALLRYVPVWAAVLLSALVFGGIHYLPGNGGVIIPLAATGVVLALVYYRTGSLVASMITHAVFNLLTVVQVVGFHQG